MDFPHPEGHEGLIDMDATNAAGFWVLNNGFWSCHLTPNGPQIASKQADLVLFCSPEAKSKFTLDYETADAQANDTIAVTWTAENAALRLRIRLDGPTLHWELIPHHVTRPVRVRFPGLIRLFADDLPGTMRLDHRLLKNAQEQPIFRHVDWPLPVVCVRSNGETLTLLMPDAPQDTTSNAVLDTAGMLFQPDSLPLRGEIVSHTGGWPAAFDLMRQRVRTRFDLREYQRPDLAWYNGQLVQHFTFLYGREILNLQTGQFELDRLLDDAQRDFGGLDGFLIWGVYPRIGIDERTQWEFYDDMPGGRDGLRMLARRAHERGVRMFVPYKPWDKSAALHGHPTPPDSQQLAQLVADVEADGVFLDTLSAIDPAFRRDIDQVRAGVVFCSEGRAKGRAFEIITGSWDQTLSRDYDQGNWSAQEETMPGVDLWRFIVPEHRLFVISRHAAGDDRI